MADLFRPFTTGPTLVTWQDLILGYSEDRVMLRIQPFWDMVHSDSYGGTAGPPADRQLLGAIVQVMAVLTTYDKESVDYLSTFSSGYALIGMGNLPPVGTFARETNGLMGVLYLQGRNEKRTFYNATLTESQELNSSARHRRYQVGWTCEVDDACAMQLMTIDAGQDPCNVT